MDRGEKGVRIFNSGYNCAQSVLLSFSDLVDIGEDSLKSISAGFGAGMGKVQTVCGAVSGAVMVIGAVLFRDGDREESKEEAYARVNEFIELFRERFSAVQCIDLIGIDISTPDGMARAEECSVFSDKCERYVAAACEILEDLLWRGEKASK